MAERLFLRHSDTLNSNYEYLYDDFKLGGQTTTEYQYRADVQHQLYESLRTVAEIDVSRKELDATSEDAIFQGGDATEDVASGQLDLDYRKIIPHGELSLNTLWFWSEQDDDSTADLIVVDREEHTFGENPADNKVIILDRDLVIQETITFEDAFGFLIVGFDEGIDYRLERIGLLTQVRLLATRDGPIDVGDTVFVNYTYEPKPRIKFRTFTQAYGTEVNFKRVWRSFYRFRRSNQKLLKGIDAGTLDDTLGRNYGTEVTWRNWTARAERLLQRSDRSPYDREIYTGSIYFPLPMGIGANLGGTYTEGETFDDVPKTYGRLINLSLNIPVLRYTFWNLRAYYRNQDLVDDGLIDVELDSDLTWEFRNLSLGMRYNYLRRRQESTGKDRRYRFLLEVRRYFGRRR
jgi:hypothetical protein